MQFQTPQFIEVEDKVFGPLTIRQFIYIAGGLGLCYLLYAFIPYLIISLPLIAAVATFAGMLAFYKYNDRPFIELVESAFRYIVGKRMYVWKKGPRTQKTLPQKPIEKPSQPTVTIPAISQEKLHDLARTLDTGSTQDNLNNRV